MFNLAAFNIDHEFRHTSTLLLLESYDILVCAMSMPFKGLLLLFRSFSPKIIHTCTYIPKHCGYKCSDYVIVIRV